MYPPPSRQGVLKLQRRLCAFPLLRHIFPRILVRGCAGLVLCAALWQPACAEPGRNVSASQWVHMPAGARAAYVGIHGGTVPVSLLTSRDGTHMVALVGQTGNDFLRTLKVNPGVRGAHPHAPPGTLSSHDDAETANSSHLNLHAPATRSPFQLTKNATLLMAGTAVGAMPVIYATGHSFAGLNQLYTDSLLFGISENSPLLEGAVKAPRKATKTAKTAIRRPLVHANSDVVANDHIVLNP